MPLNIYIPKKLYCSWTLNIYVGKMSLNNISSRDQYSIPMGIFIKE